jgi:hypothetical protein
MSRWGDRLNRQAAGIQGFNERQQVRYGSQNEVFLDLLGGCLIVSRACCCTTRSDA